MKLITDLQEVHEKIRYCRKCSLHANMPNTLCPVPGVGKANADLMLVGEALGENEALLQEPFVGLSGKLLTKILKEAGIDRSDCYITNVVHCRPTQNNKNRAPTAKEINACKLWLWYEIKVVQPKIIVMLGKVPTGTLLRKVLYNNFRMKDVFGKFYVVDYCDSTMVPSYHPSYLLQHGKDQIEVNTELFENVRKILEKA